MKDQQELFTYSDNAFCRRGLHAELRDDDPIIGDTFVNVDHVCSWCGLCVASTSWTRSAWDLKQHKAAEQALIGCMIDSTKTVIVNIKR